MLLMISMVGCPKLLSAKVTNDGSGFKITSQNIKEIQIMKLERDYYREIAKNQKSYQLQLGLSTSQGAYLGISYGF